ncbi:dihydropteroate synthase [Oceaniserpentilla sp. 4NH20-0058]|uniref:dihydropteroate synthase n=1 Tax=Oceaniserpentilla sp. 4NH20-0058 TaxID=3127660 RepID=UPI00310A44AB
MKLFCGDRVLDLSAPHVMGILNATPDSFSDGGQFNSIESGLQHAMQMVSDGASIIDVGGESTRPGSTPVSLQQELDRVVPLVEKIAQRLDVCISVDSSSPEVFLEAHKAGAHLINDVRALQKAGALQAAKQTGLPVCLMHMQGQPETMQLKPEYHQVLDEVYDFLVSRIQACNDAGIETNQILVDPGFGFGKSLEDNYQLLAKLAHFKQLGVPVLAGLSRKSMIAGVLDNAPVDQRLYGSVAGAVIAAMNGAQILRVHDVKETSDALRVVKATQTHL